MDERARDGDALQFAAGQFARHAGPARVHADGVEHRAPRALGVGSALADQRQRQRDILRDGQIGQHVKRLEHEPHALAPKLRQRVVVERARSSRRPGPCRCPAGRGRR